MWPNPKETAELVEFTEEIFTENFIFCAVLLLKAMLWSFFGDLETTFFILLRMWMFCNYFWLKSEKNICDGVCFSVKMHAVGTPAGASL